MDGRMKSCDMLNTPTEMLRFGRHVVCIIVGIREKPGKFSVSAYVEKKPHGPWVCTRQGSNFFGVKQADRILAQYGFEREHVKQIIERG